jgi:3-oxoacyl-[acyl-carrier protein] reductase
MSLVLLTHATQYAGPGAIDPLLRDGHTVACHDKAFADSATRDRFAQRHPNLHALEAQSPNGIFDEINGRCGAPDAIISNDVYPICRNEIELIPLDHLRATFEAIVVFPAQMTQLFVPAMKVRRSGTFVFVTSARESRPEPGFAVPTMLRAATTAFAKALAREGAPFGIQANVVAPNYLESEMYYPRKVYVDDPAVRDAIARIVPFGRLGQSKEIGELIAFFASGKSPFTTGQVISFSGGWS